LKANPIKEKQFLYLNKTCFLFGVSLIAAIYFKPFKALTD